MWVLSCSVWTWRSLKHLWSSIRSSEMRFINKSPDASEDQGTQQRGKCLDRSKVCELFIYPDSWEGRKSGGSPARWKFYYRTETTIEWRFPGQQHLASRFPGNWRSYPTVGPCQIHSSIRRSFQRILQCSIHTKDLQVRKDQRCQLATGLQQGYFTSETWHMILLQKYRKTNVRFPKTPVQYLSK